MKVNDILDEVKTVERNVEKGIRLLDRAQLVFEVDDDFVGCSLNSAGRVKRRLKKTLEKNLIKDSSSYIFIKNSPAQDKMESKFMNQF